MLKSKIISKLEQKISNIFGLLNLLVIDVDADSSGFGHHLRCVKFFRILARTKQYQIIDFSPKNLEMNNMQVI